MHAFHLWPCWEVDEELFDSKETNTVLPRKRTRHSLLPVCKDDYPEAQDCMDGDAPGVHLDTYLCRTLTKVLTRGDLRDLSFQLLNKGALRVEVRSVDCCV